jgi:hypothetical protein
MTTRTSRWCDRSTAQGSQPVRVRSGETPGSAVGKPRASPRGRVARRGGTTGRSAASSEACGVVTLDRVRAARPCRPHSEVMGRAWVDVSAKQRRPGVDDVSIDAVDASGVAGVRYGALPAVGVALAGKVGDLHGLTRAFTSQLRPATALTPEWRSRRARESRPTPAGSASQNGQLPGFSLSSRTPPPSGTSR